MNTTNTTAATPTAVAADGGVHPTGSGASAAPEECGSCGQRFTLARWRHRCGACGAHVCRDCSSHRVPLPKPKAANGAGDGVLGPSGGAQELQRVCLACYNVYYTISADEARLVEITAGNCTPNYRGLVVLYEQGRKCAPIMVVGKYRLFFFKRPLPGAKKTKLEPLTNFHLYNLMELSRVGHSLERLLIVFCEAKSQKRLVIASPEIPRIVFHIRKAYRCIMPQGIPDERTLLRVDLPQEMLIPIEPLGLAKAGGFSETYKAQCDFLGVPISPEVLSYVEDTDKRQNPSEFNFNDIPGFEQNSKLSWDILPVGTALFHNPFFQSLTVSFVQRKDIIPMISGIFTFNKTITKLVINNISAGIRAIADLMHCLAKNQQNIIQVIDFSGSPLSVEIVDKIAFTLTTFNHGLLGLYLANCRMQDKQVITLIRNGLMKNIAASSAIEDFDLAFNSLDIGSSQILKEWMTQMKGHSHLQRINLSGCQMPIGPFMLAVGTLPSLHLLDLSYNKFDLPSCQCLLSTIPVISSTTFCEMKLSHCCFPPSLCIDLSTSLLRKAISPESITYLDISSNFVDDQALDTFASFLDTSETHTFKLDLSDHQFSENSLIHLITSLRKNGKVQKLSLNSMSTKFTQNGEGHIVEALQDLVDNSTELFCLSLAGGWSSSVLGLFLENLSTNTRLRELDVSHNNLGLFGGGRSLGHCLRFNSSLLYLCADCVHLPTSTWHSIACDIQSNTVLQYFPFPWHDFNECASTCTPRQLDQFRIHLLEIQSSCLRNRNMAKQTRQPLWQSQLRHLPFRLPTPTNYVASLVHFEESLASTSEPRELPQNDTAPMADIKPEQVPENPSPPKLPDRPPPQQPSTTPPTTTTTTTTTTTSSTHTAPIPAQPLAPPPPPRDSKPDTPSPHTESVLEAPALSVAAPPPPPPPPALPPRPSGARGTLLSDIRGFTLTSLKKTEDIVLGGDLTESLDGEDDNEDDCATMQALSKTREVALKQAKHAAGPNSHQPQNMGALLTKVLAKRRAYIEDDSE
ncbi:F-actin-uncapping protein LRRC16A [Pelomyxa schiedti]|nr:F-actin-uncapping protein LRRC16A [Pelomyxa schiedti]